MREHRISGFPSVAEIPPVTAQELEEFLDENEDDEENDLNGDGGVRRALQNEIQVLLGVWKCVSRSF